MPGAWDGNAPAVRELLANLLQVVVAHVLDVKEENVLEVLGGLAHIVEELFRQFLALLLDLGQVNDSRALRLRHLD